MNPSKSKLLIAFALTAITAASLSQISSYLVHVHLAVGETFRLIPFIALTHVRNYGGIFGSFQGQGWLFAGFAFCFLSGVVVYLLRAHTPKPCQYLCIGLIVGGGISNILDRMLYGAVVDFIYVQGIPFWKYIFNTADVMIHLGIWPLLLLTWLDGPKEGSANGVKKA